MDINTNAIVSMTEANQNFSKVAKVVDANGTAIIFKHNKPKYIVMDIEKNEYFRLSDNEKIDVVAKRILKKHIAAFEELAK